jgi:two-component system phosphate regulon sensor histidine kinase PhoR
LKLGIRGKLFLVSLLVIVTVGLVSGAFLESRLRRQVSAREEEALLRQAQLARAALSLIEDGNVGRIDRLVDDIASVAGAHAQVFDKSGAVVGDSERSVAELAEAPRERPEVVTQALARGVVVERGLAAADSLSVTVAFPESNPRGVVELTLAHSETQAAITELRTRMLLAGMLGLAIAIFMSGLASELLSRTLRTLLEDAVKTVKGEGDARTDGALREERAALSSSRSHSVADELKEAMTSLGVERDRLQTILERMQDAVLSLDQHDRIVLANRAAFKLLHLRERDMGQLLLEAVRAPALADMVERCRAGSEAMAEFTLPRPPERQVLARAAPLRNVGGNVVVISDVTEVRRLERVRRDFVANVSHELRTPVSVIRANAETLLGGALRDRERTIAFLEAINRNAERLSNLVTDLLDLSRIEAGQTELHLHALLLEPAIAKVVEALEPRARARAIEVRVELAGELAARADANAFHTILHNLVDNALKYASERGHVTVRARPDDENEETVQIEVEDDGPGIEPHQRKRVFERFYRVDAGRSRELGGTGLGLSIVKHLSEAMGGRVGVEPGARRGSLFWVELPREVVPREHRSDTPPTSSVAPRSLRREVVAAQQHVDSPSAEAPSSRRGVPGVLNAAKRAPRARSDKSKRRSRRGLTKTSG